MYNLFNKCFKSNLRKCHGLEFMPKIRILGTIIFLIALAIYFFIIIKRKSAN